MNFLQRIRTLYALRHEPEAVAPLAAFLWRMLLICSAVATIVLLVYAVHLFESVTTTLANASNNAAKQGSSLDRAELERIVEHIRARQGITKVTPQATTTSPSTP